MATSPVLRIVSSDSSPLAQRPEGASIIATTEPALFKRRFAFEFERSVFVVDNGEDVKRMLGSMDIRFVFADFRQLADRWTGQRFLKHIRSTAALSHVAVYLMADRWEPHQEEWVRRCGAAGYVRRSPQALAKLIAGERPPWPAGFADEMALVEQIFGRYAGPMKEFDIDDARESLGLGIIEPVATAYVLELASKLALDERKTRFQAAAATALARHNEPGRSSRRTERRWP